jgi:hypothetical protein
MKPTHTQTPHPTKPQASSSFLQRAALLVLAAVIPAMLGGCAAPTPKPAAPVEPMLTTLQNNVPPPSGMDFYDFITQQNQLGRELREQATRPGLTPEQQGQEMVRLTKRAIANGRIQKGVTCLVYGTDGKLLWSNQGSEGGRTQFEAEVLRGMEPLNRPLIIHHPDGTRQTLPARSTR